MKVSYDQGKKSKGIRKIKGDKDIYRRKIKGDKGAPAEAGEDVVNESFIRPRHSEPGRPRVMR
jgi:hypothetical protein